MRVRMMTPVPFEEGPNKPRVGVSAHAETGRCRGTPSSHHSLARFIRGPAILDRGNTRPIRMSLVALISGIALAACTTSAPPDDGPVAVPAPAPEVAQPAAPRSSTYASLAPGMIFPADRSLHRPEDGVLLADGRLLVSDQVHGLVLLAEDGTSRPFGNLAAAGYQHAPPEIVGGANGLTLEPGGTHALLTDVYRGGIYRIDIAAGSSALVYQHTYGVNMARGDRAGGLWFSQSARNSPAKGEEELWGSIATGAAEGAVWYLAPGATAGAAKLVVDGLVFANGLALDEAGGYLYLAETVGGRVLRYSMDVGAGTLSEPAVLLEGVVPDNLELDASGRLWIALPLRSEIITLDLASGVQTSMFRVTTDETEATLAAIGSRMSDGAPWLDLMTPALWSPAPGAVTGMVLSADGTLRYVTSLGDALIRIESAGED